MSDYLIKIEKTAGQPYTATIIRPHGNPETFTIENDITNGPPANYLACRIKYDAAIRDLDTSGNFISTPGTALRLTFASDGEEYYESDILVTTSPNQYVSDSNGPIKDVDEYIMEIIGAEDFRDFHGGYNHHFSVQGKYVSFSIEKKSDGGIDTYYLVLHTPPPPSTV